jgi:hypothetical protein
MIYAFVWSSVVITSELRQQYNLRAVKLPFC